MEKNHLVSVNILSYNRKEDLRHTLTKVYEQDYKNIEVIVVDNASSDGSQKMVEQEFPSVKLIKLTANIGIAGWNKGFEIAKGEYVLVLDDDSYPKKNAILKGMQILTKDKSVGILAFQVIENNDLSFNSDKLLDAINFIGCGALIRNEVFYNIGYFNKDLFIYFHEVEFSMRVLNFGYKIKKCTDAVVFHKNPLYIHNMVSNNKIYYDIRNQLIIIYLYFPLRKIWSLLPRILLGKILWGILHTRQLLSVKAICAAFLFCALSVKNRQILRDDIQKLYDYGKFAGGFFFWNKNYGLVKSWK